MVVWGGLKPIASRAVFDAAAVACLLYATFAPTGVASNRKSWNGRVLVGAFVFTIATAGNFTNRWTLTFPMVPLLALQGLRRVSFVYTRRWLFYLVQILSALLIFAGVALCILFPAVELPTIDGAFHVGSIDIHVPSGAVNTTSSCSDQVFMPVRILYPTKEAPTWPKYLDPQTAFEYCRESMRFGAPPPLQSFGWMLHTWRLTSSQAKRNAKLAGPKSAKFPIVVYSHGLGGNADIYSYQTMSLAAKGSVVVVLNHLDRSGPIVRTKCGKEIILDYDIPKMSYAKQDLARRNQTDMRVREMIAATEATIRLNQKEPAHSCGTSDVADASLDFANRLNVDHITAMGHSFGGATALAAAKRRPDLYTAVVAHDPAMGWLPDDARLSFFARSRIDGLKQRGLFDESSEAYLNGDDPSVHNVDTLVLHSHEWREKKWAHIPLIEEMHQNGRLGPAQDGVVHFSVIDGAHHNEFSDTCMLTPLWLARGVGVTGTRNPLETAKEIHQRTIAFLQETRLRHGVHVPS